MSAVKELDSTDYELICDICGSSDIINTPENCICRTCGIVLNIPKLRYNYSYDVQKLQHNVLHGTQIGNYRERNQHAHLLLLKYIDGEHYIIHLDKYIIRLDGCFYKITLGENEGNDEI